MTTLQDAQSAFRNKIAGYEQKQKKRVVFLGDGKGHATSNLQVDANPSYVYARDSLSDASHYFPVKLNRGVRPAFNLPVWVGKRPNEPYERILDVVEEFADFNNSASIISGLAPHRNQHMFGGGDEVFVDSQLIKEGLLKPRSPATSVVDIFGFYYNSGSTWYYFGGSSISNLLDYVPSSGSRYVTISFDISSGSLMLTPGDQFVVPTGGSTYEELVENIGVSASVFGFNYVPTPPSGTIPLGAVSLEATTTIFDWQQNGGLENLYPIRLLLNSIDAGFAERRLDDVERQLGYSTIPTVFAANSFGKIEWNVIDGGRF